MFFYFCRRSQWHVYSISIAGLAMYQRNLHNKCTFVDDLKYHLYGHLELISKPVLTPSTIKMELIITTKRTAHEHPNDLNEIQLTQRKKKLDGERPLALPKRVIIPHPKFRGSRPITNIHLNNL